MIPRMAYLENHCLWVLLGCFFLGSTAGANVFSTQDLPYDYFDRLRTSTNQSQVKYANETSFSNVAKVELNNNMTFRLAHLAAFLPYEKGSRPYTVSESAAMLMAIHRFNSNPFDEKYFPCADCDAAKNNCDPEYCKVFLDKQKNCNVRFTTEILDTESDEVVSAAKLGVLLERKNDNLNTPRPSANIGAYRSAITSPLTILAGIEDIPQISGSSTSAYLDDKEVYPLFARTIASSNGEASAIVDYYVNLGVSRVAILYISDAFGSALQRNFEELASAVGMETTYAGYVGKPDIPTAIEQIKASKHQHVFCIAFEEEYVTILEQAYKAGIADGNHAWLFYGPIQYSVQDMAEYKKGSPLYEANKGVAIINFEAVPQTAIQYPGRRKPDPLPNRPTTATDEFSYQWRDMPKDANFLKYLKTKIPSGVFVPDNVNLIFPELMSVYAYFLYDAITAMAIAMCQTDVEFFTGQDLIDQFGAIHFEGISGYVRFNPVNTRDYTSIRFTVWNLIPAGDNEAITTENGDVLQRFLLSPTSMYADGQWEEIRPFVYADGRTIPPADLMAVETSTDDVNNNIRYIGLAFSIIIMGIFVYCMVWTMWLCRDEPIVRASQPSFLMLIAIGSLVQAGSIIPLSLNHTKNNANETDKYESACMAVPWLFYMGLSFTCAGLFCKVRRIHEIFLIPDLGRLLVEKSDFFFWPCLIVGMNGIILTLWTLMSPLVYDVVPDGSTDVFGRSTSSHGICKSQEHEDPNPFWLAILLANVATLLIANWFSYQTRAIETEYQESQFISFALGTIIESLVIGNAMQHATRDTPDAYYVITIGSIFLTSFVVAALIFAPKMMSLRAERREKRAFQARTRARRSNQLREMSGHESSGSDDGSVDDPTSGDFARVGVEESQSNKSSYCSTGVKILHHPSVAISPYGNSDSGIGSRHAESSSGHRGNVQISGISKGPLHNSGIDKSER